MSLLPLAGSLRSHERSQAHVHSNDGTVTCDRDLVVEGHIEGTINLREHDVLIGRQGSVKAEIFGRVVMVEGEVAGNIEAQRVELRSTGAVRGDVTSNEVIKEEGTRL